MGPLSDEKLMRDHIDAQRQKIAQLEAKLSELVCLGTPAPAIYALDLPEMTLPELVDLVRDRKLEVRFQEVDCHVVMLVRKAGQIGGQQVFFGPGISPRWHATKAVENAVRWLDETT